MAAKQIKYIPSQELSFEEDYFVISVSASLPDFKLAWLLNEKANTGFERVDAMPSYDETKGAVCELPLFMWSPYETVSYYLCQRPGQNSLFTASFIIIQGGEKPENIDNFIAQIEALTDFIGLVEIVPLSTASRNKRLRDYIKSVNNLLSDLEVHSASLKKEDALSMKERRILPVKWRGPK